MKQRADYTFKHNKKLGRHGWLRLTPAYSVKLVKELLPNISQEAVILDPFSGTATTGLVAAEEGLSAQLFDINPFLVWFGNAKCKNYTQKELEQLQNDLSNIVDDYENLISEENWIPSIHNIERWWSEKTLRNLSALRQAIVRRFGEPKADEIGNLIWIAFCRLVIETSSAAFNHVSMSFQDKVSHYEIQQIKKLFIEIVTTILETTLPTLSGTCLINQMDSRNAPKPNGTQYTYVITSPPYPNRISYIRELRPYMYWTKFISNARQAGELDWEAIGGTWGIATSRLLDWAPGCMDLPNDLFIISDAIRQSDHKNARLMGQYVLKYFHDMHTHLSNLRKNLAPRAKLMYIVGNSTFYGIQVHTEQLLSESLKKLGFINIDKTIIRKRNCKKELFEFCVSATWNM
ncbi:MAG: DNA adenine methylase [Pseudomonadota bacterium]